MSPFKPIRECFATIRFHHTLLMLTFAAVQLFARNSEALPVVIGAAQQTDRFGPHSFPGWIPVGDKVQVFAAVESSDPGGSPTISVQAVQGGTTLALNYFDPNNHPIYEGFPYYIYYNFIDLDPGLTGSWEITLTDSTGTGLPTFGDAITEPEFLPLVEDIALYGTPHGERVTWTLPNLDGFDVDDVSVLIIDAVSGSNLWQSAPLPVETTTFEPRAGVLKVGVEYVYGIILGDIEGQLYENISYAFSEPFRYTIAGDFNTDGIVDAADYVAWRKGFAIGAYTQNEYNAWRTNFGSSLGPGSGSAIPSAAPLWAAVPEPSRIMLAALFPMFWSRCRCCRRRIEHRQTLECSQGI
jgi:hypothetical protein